MRSDDRGQDDSTDEHDTPVMSPNLRGRRLDVTPPGHAELTRAREAAEPA